MPLKKKLQFFYKFNLLLKEFRKQIFFFFIVSLLGVTIELISLSALIPVVNLVFDQEKFLLLKERFFLTEFSFNESVIIFLIFIVLIFFIKFLFFIFLNWFSNNLIKDCSIKLTNDFFTGYLNKNYIYHIDKHSMKTINIIQEVDSVSRVLLKSFLNIFINLAILLSVVFFLLYVNYAVTLYFLTFISSVSLIIIFFFKEKLLKLSKIIFESSRKKLFYLGENLKAIKDIKINNLNDHVSSLFFKANIEHFNSGAKRDTIKAYPHILFEYIFILLVVFLILIIKKDEQHYLMELGSTLTFFMIASVRCIPMISSILSNMQIIKAKKYSLDIVADEYQILSKSKKNYNLCNKNEKIIFNNSINLKNVNFLYNDNIILRNANMEIKRGSFIGLIGESGTGKSTLLNIIAGLLKCNSGKILIDNNEKNIYENNCWYDKISYVSQNVYLSDDSILNNIALGKKDKNLKLDEIMDIIEKVNLLDFVKDLKKGIKTFIGEGGGKLSGGQIQRIGLARAIYKNADIFILDEPTNSLDANNEKNILNLLKTLKKKKTIIMSSHKKENFHFCDKLLKLSNGKIIEIKR